MIRSKPPMPKLSSAETPPEKSRACLPVSTMALVGSITRMPLVCMSIVASAFQYGWPPTLIPVTTMFTSPPRWVYWMRPRSTSAIQSMFSVPLSMAISAPDETANHSTGTRRRSARSSAARIRRHSGSARLPSPWVGSLSSATRVIPSGTAAVRLVISPTTTLAVFSPGSRSTGTRSPSESRSYSVKLPGGNPAAVPSCGVSSRTISYGYGTPNRSATSTFCRYGVSGRTGSSPGCRSSTVMPWPPTPTTSRTASRVVPPGSGIRTRSSTFSRPAPAASGANDSARCRQKPGGTSHGVRT